MRHREKRTLYQSNYCSIIECINDFGEVWVLDSDHRMIASYIYADKQELKVFIKELSKRCRDKNVEAVAFYLFEKLEACEVRHYADLVSLYQIFGEDRVYRIGTSAIIMPLINEITV